MLASLPTFADVVIPLTYTGRSTEASGSVAYSPTLGGESLYRSGLAAQSSQTIFDNGAYHTQDATPTGVTWASWPILRGQPIPGPAFRATFVLPTGIGTIQNFVLFSPYYTAARKLTSSWTTTLIFYLNGTYIGDKGNQLRRVQRAPQRFPVWTS